MEDSDNDKTEEGTSRNNSGIIGKKHHNDGVIIPATVSGKIASSTNK